MVKVKVDNLTDAIMKELSAYRKDVTDGLKQEIKEAAKECLAEIKRNSPRDTGSYRKGWRRKTVYEGWDDIRIDVYNKTDYQLTHLLEYGHAKVNGGRVDGKPHIGPAQQNTEKKLERKVRVLVKGGA